MTSSAIGGLKAATHRITSQVPHVVVAMSGGVDSSAVAALALKSGWKVSGLFMRNWDHLEDGWIEPSGTAADLSERQSRSSATELASCTAEDDWKDVQRVGRALKMDPGSLHRVDFVQEYWTHVFESFLSGLTAGLTPNPDVLCNKHIKFRAFAMAARDLGGDYMATGHYAQTSFNDTLIDWDSPPPVTLQEALDPSINCSERQVALMSSVDRVKDQTYFLPLAPPPVLSASMFPLGRLASKDEVRGIAAAASLPTASKRESMGICFIGTRRAFASWLEEYIPPSARAPGSFVHLETGQVLGRHRGAIGFTLGQRARLGGQPDPLFVASKDMESGVVGLVPGARHPALFTSSFSGLNMSWIRDPPPFGSHLLVRTRHRAELAPVQVLKGSSGSDVRFVAPSHGLRAITPGQAVVAYSADGSECLGGGTIARPGPSFWASSTPLPQDNNFLIM